MLFIITFCKNLFASDTNNSLSIIDKKNIENFIENIAIEFENINKIQDSNNKETKVYEISNNILDLKWMGNFILGKHRNTIDESKKNDFIENYSKLLIKNYISILDVYKKDSYKITSIELIKNNTFNVSTVISYDDKNVKNNFKIIKKNDKYFIRDIITEGISFISAQRSEINSVISSKGFDNFLKELKNKNADK